MAPVNQVTAIDALGLYDAGQVTRYHSNPQMNRRLQTNADHSWGVCAILFALYNGRPPLDLLLHGLFHDVGERRVGDPPADFKRKFPELATMHREAEGEARGEIVGEKLPPLTAHARTILKAADIIEAMLCILMYAPNPSRVEGFPEAVRALSECCGQMPHSMVYDFCEAHVNPLLATHFPTLSVVPF